MRCGSMLGALKRYVHASLLNLELKRSVIASPHDTCAQMELADLCGLTDDDYLSANCK